MTPQNCDKLVKELCGDAVNGGFIRNLCFTVWQLCHNPKHEDGNTDWFNDTLPTVHKGVEQIRQMVTEAHRQSTSKGCEVTGDREKALDAFERIVQDAIHTRLGKNRQSGAADEMLVRAALTHHTEAAKSPAQMDGGDE